MENLVSIIIALLAFIGIVLGSYFANRKTTALLTYRMEQVEKQVAEVKQEIKELRNEK